jgi:membrane protease subunit HflK
MSEAKTNNENSPKEEFKKQEEQSSAKKSKQLKKSWRQKLADHFGLAMTLGILGILLLLLVILLFENQLYTKVESYERAVRFTLGKAEEQALGPGFHWRLPDPFQKVIVVNAATERKVQLGFRVSADSGRVHHDRDALILTRGGNLVDIEAEVNYHIENLVNYVLFVEDPDETIADVSEAAFKTVVGSYSVEDILTNKKALITAETQRLMQEILDYYQMGVRVSRVQLIKVLNPLKVREAFESVESAKQDSSISVEQALGYRNEVVPKARGEAGSLVTGAEAYAIKRIAEAEAETAAFNALLEKYRGARKVTRKRLYLETMEEVLPGKKKFIVDPKSQGLHLLPLGSTGGQR